MSPEEKVLEIIGLLKKEYPAAGTTLSYHSPFEMLAATILSAQCTDARVNIVTKSLFRKYRTVDDYANAELKEFEQDVKSTGFYRNKAKNIINTAKMIISDFNGKVPGTMEDMLKLPGVGRKTANVVLENAYGIVKGIAVDTHVKRLSQRLGLSMNKDPVKIEQDLIKIVPEKEWSGITYYLIGHGRKICDARKPKCPECVLNKICASAFSFERCQ